MKRYFGVLLLAFLSLQANGYEQNMSIHNLLDRPIKVTFVNGDTFLQRDLTDYLNVTLGIQEDPSNDFQSDAMHNLSVLRHYFMRPHPSVSTIIKYFNQASNEFGVPVSLLMIIGQIENNWTQTGPTIDQGWGIMHLVKNNYCNTLGDAAQLLGVSEQILKDDALQNIRGAAALIAQYAGENLTKFSEMEDWFPAIARFSGLLDTDLREMQAKHYLEALNGGIKAKTIWGEEIIIKSTEKVNSTSNYLNKYIGNSPSIPQSSDYAPALTNWAADCNYGTSRNHSIDTWVNHWIGSGTYLGAISWFKTCPGAGSGQRGYNQNTGKLYGASSAHFVIKNSNGEITQMVAIAVPAYHCGAEGYLYNNGRSIGVEHEATAANPNMWNSPAMLNASATMARYFKNQIGFPVTQNTSPGICGHNDMPGTSTDCPGPLPWASWMNYFNESANLSGLRISAGTNVYATRSNTSTIYSLPNEYGGTAPSAMEKNFAVSFKIKNNGSSSVNIEDVGAQITKNGIFLFRLVKGIGGNLSPNGELSFDVRGYITDDQLGTSSSSQFKAEAQYKVNGNWVLVAGSGNYANFTVSQRPSLANGMLIKKPRPETSSNPDLAKIYYYQNGKKWAGTEAGFDGIIPNWDTIYYVYPSTTINSLGTPTTPNTNSTTPLITGRNLLYKKASQSTTYIIEPEPSGSSLRSRPFANETAFYSYGYTSSILANEVVPLNDSQFSWVQSQYPPGTTISASLSSISLNRTFLGNSCTQGSNASMQNFELWSSGSGTLSYTINDNVSWLSCSPTSGTSTTEHDPITVNYATSSLTAGTYNAIITISASGASNSPQTITVTLTVNANATFNPPRNLTATAGNQQVSLSWSAPSNKPQLGDEPAEKRAEIERLGLSDDPLYKIPSYKADGESAIEGLSNYKVYRSTSENGSYSLVNTASSTNYTDTGRTNGTMYWYYVTAVYSSPSGESNASNKVSAVPQGSTNATQLTVNGSAVNGSIGTSGEADWYYFVTSQSGDHVMETHGSMDTYMHLYRSDRTTEIIQDDDSGEGTCSKITYSLSSGTTYYVKVRAYDASATGSYSVDVKGPGAATFNPPRNLTATAGNQQVSLSWSAPSNKPQLGDEPAEKRGRDREVGIIG